MGAKEPARRTKTARELAEQFGATPRTIRRLIAEPRDDFEARAAARRAQAVELREQGMSYKEIAEAMGTGTGTVGRLLHDHRKRMAS
ncbi:replication protein RepB [Rhodococcus sp. ACS1]|uniref:helix-turn-helix domain-containing protein n=1 Tax=Rhodococcus sp. ACS1 TaxID=2028570 RepID=UPI000BB13A57|nr:helix-turn-helix domain-containing protein [Rhodococcus sp. ACS1]PBC35038.1 replication protein RepB [Rhodococcus sp. ACS1]